MVKAVVMKNPNADAKTIVLERIIRNGNVAFSPRRYCEYNQIGTIITNPPNRRRIIGLDQGYVEPPHSRARTRQIFAGIKKIGPI